MLDLPVGNLTVTVSDKTSRSVRLPESTVENLSEFFSRADRTATVYLGGEYHRIYFIAFTITRVHHVRHSKGDFIGEENMLPNH